MPATTVHSQPLWRAGVENTDVYIEALKAMLEQEAMGRQPMDSDIKEIKKGIETILHRMELTEAKLDGRFKRFEDNIHVEFKEFPDNINTSIHKNHVNIDRFYDKIPNEFKSIAFYLSNEVTIQDKLKIFTISILMLLLIISI
ncbi:hypothetical protein JHL17_13180 [Azospirillum sp. YIM B02556]|uniref:Uncharacterized protein n=1 Tax=Azospirillum endophyticum TaxID=2800326 RepID=A0ABS1F4R0_9PROT|nr:hypothetical protein [Azospirillum endophyticum]MBK1838369.1 hypothetical protein [Azospirillum endophyticum]